MDKFRPSPVFRKGFQATPSSFKRQQKEDETANWDKVVIGVEERRRPLNPSRHPSQEKGGKQKALFFRGKDNEDIKSLCRERRKKD